MPLTKDGRLRLEAYLLLGKLASRSSDSRNVKLDVHTRLQHMLVMARRRFVRRADAAQRKGRWCDGND